MNIQIEQYSGIIILATNRQQDLDEAMHRRSGQYSVVVVCRVTVIILCLQNTVGNAFHVTRLCDENGDMEITCARYKCTCTVDQEIFAIKNFPPIAWVAKIRCSKILLRYTYNVNTVQVV